MRRILAVVVATIMTIMSCFSFAGCGVVTKDAVVINTEFYYSSDDGVSYRPEARRLTVDTPMLMKIIITVGGTKLESQSIHGTIAIPQNMNMDFLDAIGATVTDGKASDSNVATYDFDVQANFVSVSPLNQVELIFAFTPKEEAKHTITVTFDDQVAPKYDRTHSVLFVASETDDWE